MTLPKTQPYEPESKEQQQDELMMDENEMNDLSSNPSAPSSTSSKPITIPFALETRDDRTLLSRSLSLLQQFDHEKQKLLIQFNRVNDKIMNCTGLTPAEVDAQLTNLTTMTHQFFQQLLSHYIQRASKIVKREIITVNPSRRIITRTIKIKQEQKDVDMAALESEMEETQVQDDEQEWESGSESEYEQQDEDEDEDADEHEDQEDQDEKTQDDDKEDENWSDASNPSSPNLPKAKSSSSTTTKASKTSSYSKRTVKLDDAFRPTNPTGYKPKSNAGQRRRNLDPRIVAILMKWVKKHHDNPYPDEFEKQTLKDQTGMRTQQLNNWFINYRGRKWNPELEANYKPRKLSKPDKPDKPDKPGKPCKSEKTKSSKNNKQTVQQHQEEEKEQPPPQQQQTHESQKLSTCKSPEQVTTKNISRSNTTAPKGRSTTPTTTSTTPSTTTTPSKPTNRIPKKKAPSRSTSHANMDIDITPVSVAAAAAVAIAMEQARNSPPITPRKMNTNTSAPTAARAAASKFYTPTTTSNTSTNNASTHTGTDSDPTIKPITNGKKTAPNKTTATQKTTSTPVGTITSTSTPVSHSPKSALQPPHSLNGSQAIPSTTTAACQAAMMGIAPRRFTRSLMEQEQKQAQLATQASLQMETSQVSMDRNSRTGSPPASRSVQTPRRPVAQV